MNAEASSASPAATDAMKTDDDIECAIAMVWPEGKAEPLCEMFRVDRRSGRWCSKHYSSGMTFADGGHLHRGETARSLAQSGTGSGLYRYLPHTPVTFVVASLDVTLFESTRPTDWTLEQLKRLPDADVVTFPR
jgi:hypothetical protein